jgi:hypothetical protein
LKTIIGVGSLVAAIVVTLAVLTGGGFWVVQRHFRPTSVVTGLPTAAIPQVPGPMGVTVTCTVPANYFVFNAATLIDAAKTIQDLTPCITDALRAHATFALDGWTSYEGPLNADGKPAINDPRNLALSDERVQTIANLLVNDLGVPTSAITRMTGHGNIDQPDPDPRSPANRVVVITYTISPWP